jgi:hypothetical protein
VVVVDCTDVEGEILPDLEDESASERVNAIDIVGELLTDIVVDTIPELEELGELDDDAPNVGVAIAESHDE